MQFRRVAVPWIAIMCMIGPLACDRPDGNSQRQGTAPATRSSESSNSHGPTSTRPLSPAVSGIAPAATQSGPVLKVADLHNVRRLTTKIYCGSVPDTDDAFLALAALGVKTIISVDGAKPMADMAEKRGLRDVHLPFGYDGISRERQLEIARAVTDLPGPIYIHCHHGLHRGPAAAVVAAEATAGWTPEQAVGALRELGTSPQYQGLYAAARNFRKPGESELAHADASFPRVSKLDDLADVMVEVDSRWDHLKAAQKSGWKTPANQPDIDPPHEALMLKELLREAHRPGGPAQNRPVDLVERLKAAEKAAEALEGFLRAGDYPAANIVATTMQNACGSCHTQYRNPARHE